MGIFINKINNGFLGGFLFMVLLAACGGTGNNNGAEAVVDSVAVEEAVPVDTFDVEAFNSFSTPDLKSFWLHGHVSKLVEKDGKFTNVVEFSTAGQATVKSYYGTDCRVKRNKKGQITSIGTVLTMEQEGSFYSFTYNADGYPRTINEEHPSWFTVYSTKYSGADEHGWPLKSSMVGGEGGVADCCDLNLSYPDVDEVGNWTTSQQRGKSYSIYETEYGPETSDVKQIKTKVTRTITYYTCEEVNSTPKETF